MKYTPRQPESNVNVTPTSPLREFFVLTAALLGIVVGIYFLLGLTVDLVLPHISMGLEKKMATLFIGSFMGKGTDSEREQAVQSLITTMRDQCASVPYEFKIHVRKADPVNAMAMPGGHIIVFTGLLDKVTSENELAFVLAHEMGHYAHRDHLRALGRGLVFMAISASLFGPDSGVSKMLAHALNITELSFSRMQETQADEFALETVHCFYGHAGGATDFFEKIPKAQDPGTFGHYFASHPENRRRISHLEDIIRSKGFKLAERKPLPEAMKREPLLNN
jgi:Zn-dependent protease with chaperone function